MGVKIYTREAKSLLDLITLIAEAIGELGPDAYWSGHEDGSLYMWGSDDGPIYEIEPSLKPLSKEPEREEEP